MKIYFQNKHQIREVSVVDLLVSFSFFFVQKYFRNQTSDLDRDKIDFKNLSTDLKREEEGESDHIKKIQKKNKKIAPTRRRCGGPPRRRNSGHLLPLLRRRPILERSESFTL